MTEPVSRDHVRSVQSDDGLTLAEALPGQVHEELVTFLTARAEEIRPDAPEASELVDLTVEFLGGGKYLRSTFAYLGWLANARASPAARRAAASVELLHAFALMQDDVMDGSTVRRGRPAMHRRLQQLHGRHDDDRFGESAATVLGDLCLVWSEQLWRTSGLSDEDLARATPCYDTMRQELAVGQYLDLLYSQRTQPRFSDALRLARLKSARYTVTRPLQLGALLAGADQTQQRALWDYGDAVGEAFQMRDDILGATGDPTVTGKPVGDDLRDGKMTTVLTLATERADTRQRDRLRQLLERCARHPQHLDELRDLIDQTGVFSALEHMIRERVTRGKDALARVALSEKVRLPLCHMADRCADRRR